MDEVSSYFRLDLPSRRRQGRPIDCSASSSNPMMEGPWCRFRREARAREQHRHAAVYSLKVLDPKWPIREATKFRSVAKCRDGPGNDISPHYSITSSARASSDGGMVRPSALAVFRLIANSYVVGACTGRAAAFSPLRMG